MAWGMGLDFGDWPPDERERDLVARADVFDAAAAFLRLQAIGAHMSSVHAHRHAQRMAEVMPVSQQERDRGIVHVRDTEFGFELDPVHGIVGRGFSLTGVRRDGPVNMAPFQFSATEIK